MLLQIEIRCLGPMRMIHGKRCRLQNTMQCPRLRQALLQVGAQVRGKPRPPHPRAIEQQQSANMHRRAGGFQVHESGIEAA